MASVAFASKISNGPGMGAAVKAPRPGSVVYALPGTGDPLKAWMSRAESYGLSFRPYGSRWNARWNHPGPLAAPYSVVFV